MSESPRKHFLGCLHCDVRYEFKHIIQINMLCFLIEVAWSCWYSLWYVRFQYLFIMFFILDFYILPQTFLKIAFAFLFCVYECISETETILYGDSKTMFRSRVSPVMWVLEIAKADDLSSISKTHMAGETHTYKISKQAILSVLLLKKIFS